jgi:hypothetical protein
MSVSVSVSIRNNEKRIKTHYRYLDTFGISKKFISFSDEPTTRSSGYTTNSLTKQRMVGIPETIFFD